MKSLIMVWFVVIFSPFWPVLAAFEELPGNARSVALGMTGAADDDRIDQLCLNPACLAELTGWQSAFYITRPFGIKEISVQTFCVGHPVNRGVLAVRLHLFGAPHYQEQQMSLAWAGRAGNNLTVGIALRTGRLQISRYGSAQAWMLDLGIRHQPLPHLKIGTSLTNLNRARIGANRESLPQTLRLGMQTMPLETIKVNLEWIKDSRYPVQMAGGVEIQIFDIGCVRAGFSNHPDYLCAGTGFRIHQWVLDYAYAIHPVLGGTHHISLLFRER